MQGVWVALRRLVNMLLLLLLLLSPGLLGGSHLVPETFGKWVVVYLELGEVEVLVRRNGQESGVFQREGKLGVCGSAGRVVWHNDYLNQVLVHCVQQNLRASVNRFIIVGLKNIS